MMPADPESSLNLPTGVVPPVGVGPGADPGGTTMVPGGGSSREEQRFTRNLVIQNQLGMHARPCGKFVRISQRYRADIRVEKDGDEVNGKSIMGLMMLAAGQGSRLRVTAEGPDAQQAIDELEHLVQSRFEED